MMTQIRAERNRRNDEIHAPVLKDSVLAFLSPVAGGRYVDGTLGAAGHARAILAACAPDGQLLGLDRDPAMLAIAHANLAGFAGRAHAVHASYVEMTRHAHDLGWETVDGIVLDLGISSLHVDQPERGFSFQADGPLDMRFDPASGALSAADIVNTWADDALADLLFTYGEERQSRRIARAIVAARPIHTTLALAEVIVAAQPPQRGPRRGPHPATRSFQALRIAVNDELTGIERVLPEAIDLLRPGGRLVVISFHSLEDRLVKRAFRDAARDCICPAEHVQCTCEHTAQVRILTGKPVVASPDEIARNPRSRSAKLRAVERLVQA